MENSPLVSIIIPTFNRPEYFKIALESALNQTYKNFEIFISDNSTTDDTENLIQPYLEKYPCIKYFRHENFTASDNWNFARHYNNPDAEFVNWLLDDDLFYPQKLEVMVEVLRQNPDCSLCSSVRDVIDEKGTVVWQQPDMDEPELKILKETDKISGEVAGKLMLEVGKNYIGEPTTALIRKSCLRNNDLCWTDGEDGFFALIDVSTWCQLLSQGNLYWISDEPFSAFRRHDGQASYWDNSEAIFQISWARIFKTAWDKKIFVKTEKEIHKLIVGWVYCGIKCLAKAFQKDQYDDETFTTLEKTMVAMLEALYSDYKIDLPPRIYGGKDKIKSVS